MKKKEIDNILYVSTFPPRECGIATFTKDLTSAMDHRFNPSLKSKILAINENGSSIYNYGGEVKFQLNESDIENYTECAEKVNKSEKIKLVSIQHEFGIFGGLGNGEYLIPFMQKRNIEMLKQAYEYQPKSYEELIALKGVGAKTVRSLALISELIYGEEITWKDPVKYSFAVGGKDKIPYEINKSHYDKTTDILETALEHAKIDQKSRLIGIKKLAGMYA